MGFALGPRAEAAGFRLAAYDTIGSTSTEALERAKAGDPGRLWVVARQQSAGRGRRGREWQTPQGNLAASLLLIFPAGSTPPATLGFAAGLAVEHAIRAVAGESGGAALRLKWPNDILIGDSKVAGILLEATNLPRGGAGLVVGIGVNVLAAPADLPYPATSLAACGMAHTAEHLFAAISDAWVEQERAWDCGRGFGGIRRAWLERAAGLGAPISVRVGEKVIRGTFETIDESGMLMVRSPDGSAQAVAAGDVHFGAAATMGAA